MPMPWSWTLSRATAPSRLTVTWMGLPGPYFVALPKPEGLSLFRGSMPLLQVEERRDGPDPAQIEGDVGRTEEAPASPAAAGRGGCCAAGGRRSLERAGSERHQYRPGPGCDTAH